MSHEDTTRRLIAATERLHEAATLLRRWAAGYLPGDMPAPLQAVIDAADYYEQELDHTEPRKEDAPAGHGPADT